MKKTLLLLTLISGLLTIKAQENTLGPKVTNEPTIYKGVTDQSCALEVNFGSYSAGIDGPALDKVMELIKKYNLAYTSKNVGREGETRICLPLTELKGKKRTKFINQLKKIAKEGQLVSLSIR